jgi:hypothetical protein
MHGSANAILPKAIVNYRSIHLLGVVPEGIEGCKEFWSARRERLREKITAVLNPMALQTSQKVQEQDAYLQKQAGVELHVTQGPG